jgi:hypothetical protein
MPDNDCCALHRWLVAVVRANPTRADIDDCLDLLSRLDRAEKRAFWQWLASHDPNLKRWLKAQGQQREVA